MVFRFLFKKLNNEPISHSFLLQKTFSFQQQKPIEKIISINLHRGGKEKENEKFERKEKEKNTLIFVLYFFSKQNFSFVGSVVDCRCPLALVVADVVVVHHHHQYRIFYFSNKVHPPKYTIHNIAYCIWWFRKFSVVLFCSSFFLFIINFTNGFFFLFSFIQFISFRFSFSHFNSHSFLRIFSNSIQEANIIMMMVNKTTTTAVTKPR